MAGNRPGSDGRIPGNLCYLLLRPGEPRAQPSVPGCSTRQPRLLGREKRGQGGQGNVGYLGDPASQPLTGSQIPMGCCSLMATGQMFEAPAVLWGRKQQQQLQRDPRDLPRSPSAPLTVPDPPMGAEVTPGSAPRALRGWDGGMGEWGPSLGQERPQPFLLYWGSAPSINDPLTLLCPTRVPPQCVVLFPTPMCSVPPQ